jgi:nicotinate phosphoribosyltransferase
MYSQDFYKMSMIMALIQNFGTSHKGKALFKLRSDEKIGVLADRLRRKFEDVKTGVRKPYNLTPEAVEYLVAQGISRDVLMFLMHDSFKQGDTDFVCENRDEELYVSASGYLHDITWFEMPVLKNVQQEWSRHNGWMFDKEILKEGIRRLEAKVEVLNRLPKPSFIVEMSTRRAMCEFWHRYVVSYLAWKLKCFAGTSNIGLAMELGVPCKGTVAHEFMQLGQVFAPSLKEANTFMLKAWQKSFPNSLKICLPDCLTTDFFLTTFDKEQALHFDGSRQDSGSPYEYGGKFRDKYRDLGIDPIAENKGIMFSDSLNTDKIMSLDGYFHDMFGWLGYGVGEHLGHDLGVKPIKCVMKLVEVDGNPVVKIPDEAGKVMSTDDKVTNRVKKELGL